MRALVQDTYGSADVLELRDVDRPVPGDREVLVRVHAAGIDRGVWHLVTGLPYPARLAFGLRRPRVPVPGMDVAGVVEAVGPEVTRFAVGDEVFGIGRGTFAEYAVAAEDKLARRPGRLTATEAAVLAVQRVAPGGAAAAAGVRVGDVLLELCGVSVRGRGAAGMHEALAAVAAAHEAAGAAGDGRGVDVAWVFQVRKRSFYSHLYAKMIYFTKTGSGHT